MAVTNVRVTEYQVSCLPQDGSARGWGGVFDVHVQWSGVRDLWAVRANGRVYDAAGVEEYEPIPSERSEGFLARFRHDQQTAMRIAHMVAPTITINGTTAEQAARALAAEAGPFGTYPGHDMSVTVGGCSPTRPCPACQQRISEQTDDLLSRYGDAELGLDG
jgi:hypothetical protein